MSAEIVTTVTPRILIEECARLGINQDKLLNETGISRDCLYNASGHIPVEKMYILWNSAIELSGDRMFAVHAAERVPFGAYRVLDYMFAVSSTPRDALVRSSQSFGLFNNAFRLSFRMYRNLAYLELFKPCNPQDLPRPYIEYIFTNYLVRLRMVTQKSCNPAEIHVTYKEPSSAAEYQRIFGAPVRFQRASNCLVFPRELLEIRHPLADPELCDLLEHHAQRGIQHLCSDKRPLEQIHDALVHGLEVGNVTLTALSRQLAKSSRSLQRTIHANGMTFRGLLDSVRQERALALLADHELPLIEIAAKLQFSSPSAFCHAFQRWTGRSPHQHRRKQQAPFLKD
jgi:AraC-like DNA-binding protein